jgi:oligopeptide/dipeptide ABC transporter ATP-binding protein
MDHMNDPTRPLLEVSHLSVRFHAKRAASRWIQAVDDVSLSIHAGESVGLVGESGSGKTSLGRAILRLVEWSQGSVVLDGVSLGELSGSKLRAMRKRMQMVLQDPRSSVDPRFRVDRVVAEPLRIHGIASSSGIKARVAELLELVALDGAMARRFPHELSGGQLQRVGIAQALAADPEFLILDEPVSALDVSVQAQIINLLIDLRSRLNLTYLFIGHDLDVVRRVCDRVLVMYLGSVVEAGPVDDVYDNPRHPYTKALLSASPKPDPVAERSRQQILITGERPSPGDIPSGCRFHQTCWLYEQLDRPARCREEAPVMTGTEHRAACHFQEETRAGVHPGPTGRPRPA